MARQGDRVKVERDTKKELQLLKKQLKEEQELHRQHKELQWEQVQHKMKHAQTDETAPIQVLESSEQLAQGRQGEQSQEHDLAQDIEQMIEQMDTNVVQPELDQDIDLMHHNQEVTPPASSDPKVEKIQGNQ